MTIQVQSPELQSKIAEYRAKAADGTITLDEMRQAIIHMRGDRYAALNAAAKAGRTSKAKDKGPVKSADDLLSEIM